MAELINSFHQNSIKQLTIINNIAASLKHQMETDASLLKFFKYSLK